MIRKQFKLSEKQVAALRRLAAKRHVSMAEMVRQAVDYFLQMAESANAEEQRKQAIAIAGRFHSGRSGLSAKHDEHLAEIYKK